MEHRWGRRLPLELPVRVSAGALCIPIAYLRDVSLSGAALETGVPLRILSAVEISMTDGCGRGFALTGFVVRATRTIVGVEWSEFAPAPIAVLVRKLEETPEAVPVSPLAVTL